MWRIKDNGRGSREQRNPRIFKRPFGLDRARKRSLYRFPTRLASIRSTFPPIHVPGQTQAATVPSTSWDNALDEGKPAIYLIKYEYDKVGNRTAAIKLWRDGTPTSERWTYTYNDLNQLTQRNLYSALYGTGVTNKWVYTYDDNGNMTVMSKQT